MLDFSFFQIKLLASANKSANQISHLYLIRKVAAQQILNILNLARNVAYISFCKYNMMCAILPAMLYVLRLLIRNKK